ncbi:MAG: PHP domain-containing protein [Myxococcaceae bacterium]|nr:PHP domain-containing protein [Myxococcaceae bacterium]
MIELHAHTTASDGQYAPSELVRRAHAAGVTTLAVTDHDTLAGLPEALETARSLGGIAIVPGIEISTEINGTDIHVLGHFVAPDDPVLLRYAEHQGGERRRRMKRMVEKLRALGYPVTLRHVEEVAGGENLCRPHLARALVSLGIVRDVQEAFRKLIGDDGPAFSPQERLPAKEAIALIHQAGGTATLAHPGVDRIDRYQIGELAKEGLDGLEALHADHVPSQREKYLKIARELDLVPTAGSDFHGEAVAPDHTLGMVQLSPEQFDALRERRGGRRP